MPKLVSSHAQIATRKEPSCTPLLDMNCPKVTREEVPPQVEKSPEETSQLERNTSSLPCFEWNPEFQVAIGEAH